MPRKKSKPQQRQRGGGDAAAFFSEAGNIDRLGADKTSSPSKSVGQENETLSCGPTLCLSTLSETGTGGGRCRLRRWPVLLPFADKSAAIFATPEHYRICEKGQEDSVLMESLPASEIEEFLNFFKQKDLIPGLSTKTNPTIPVILHFAWQPCIASRASSLIKF